MPGENRNRRPRFPALFALAAFFSNLKNPFKRPRREETIPTKFEHVESDSDSDTASSVEVSRDTSCTRVSSSMGLLKRIRHSIQGLHRWRVKPKNLVSQTEVNEVKLEASPSQNLDPQRTFQEETVVEFRKRRVDTKDRVLQTLVHAFKLDASSSQDLVLQPTFEEEAAADLFKKEYEPRSAKENNAFRDTKNDDSVYSINLTATRSDQAILQIPVEITTTHGDQVPEKVREQQLLLTEVDVSESVSSVFVPRAEVKGSFDNVEVLSQVPESKAESKPKYGYGAEVVDALKGARVEVPLDIETANAMTHKKVASSVETEVTVFDIQAMNVPTTSEENLQIYSSVTTLVSSRGSEYTTPVAGEQDSDWQQVEHSKMPCHILSTSAAAVSTQVPATADCVLEDVESFDREMKYFQENISEINAFIHGSNDDVLRESKSKEPIAFDTANKGTSQCRSLSDSAKEDTSNGLNIPVLDSVKEGSRNGTGSPGSIIDAHGQVTDQDISFTSNGESSSNSLRTQHEFTDKEITSNEESSSNSLVVEAHHQVTGDEGTNSDGHQSSSSSMNIPRVVDASEIPLAYRRRLKLKQALQDLPKEEEYLYNAVIAAEMAEADKVSDTDAGVFAVAASKASAPKEVDIDDTSKSESNECGSVAERIRDAVEKMAKNLEHQVAHEPSEEKRLTQEEEEARQLGNKYGYPPPIELGQNPPEIKSYSQRRCQKIRERLENIQYEPCPRTDENWTDNVIGGQRIKYEKYTDSDHVIKIGSGSFGDVYLGMMDRTKLVVIKLFKTGKSDLESIAKEATITQLLAGTKCTPQYLGLIALPENETYVRLGIVLEYIGDNYLNAKYSRFFEIFRSEVRRISQGRRPYVPVRDWLKICYKLADGLRKIHEQGIIVNDLKCDNLLLNYDGRHYNPYVIDFGISRSVNDEDVYQIPVLAEDWAYFSEHYSHVAPEIYQGGHATLQSDIFSLGAILLTIDGIFHFKIRSIAKACRQTDPEKRPTAGELVAMIEHALKSYHK